MRLKLVYFLLSGITFASTALAQPFTVGDVTIALPEPVDDATSIVSACPSADAVIEAACVSLAATRDSEAYSVLADAYLWRGQRSPPVQTRDGVIGYAASVAALRLLSAPNAVQRQALPNSFGAKSGRLRAIAEARGDAAQLEQAATLALAAFALCGLQDYPECKSRHLSAAATSFGELGFWQNDLALLERGANLFRQAVAAMPTGVDPQFSLSLQAGLAKAYIDQAALTADVPGRLAILETALTELPQPSRPVEGKLRSQTWWQISVLAGVRAEKALLEQDYPRARAAIDDFQNSIKEAGSAESPRSWAQGNLNLSRFQQRLGHKEPSMIDAVRAVESATEAVRAWQDIGEPQRLAYARLTRAGALIMDACSPTKWAGPVAKRLLAEARQEMDESEPVFAAAGAKTFLKAIAVYRAWIATNEMPTLPAVR